MITKSKTYGIILLYIIFSIIPNITSGQNDSVDVNSKSFQKSYIQDFRKWTIEVPIWIPGFVGEFSYGDISIEGEDGSNPGIPEHPIEPPDPGEPPIGGGNIISRLFTSSSYLKFFFMNRVTYRPGKFLFQFDTFAGAVGDKLNFKLNDATVVNAEIRTILFRLYAGYSLIDYIPKSQKIRLELYGFLGARFHLFHLETQTAKTNIGFDIDPFWAEPVIGLNGRLALNSWLFEVSGDLGGFYIDEKFSFMLTINGFYRISRLISVKLGWTDWRIKHRGMLRGETLYIKTHLSGPNTGLIFNF